MRALLYIQIYQGYFIAKRIGSSKTVRRECAGLDHPRTLISDFHNVQDTLKSAVDELLPRVRLLRPKGLIHLVPTYEGGYTSVERCAFKEVGEVAGINFTHLSESPRTHTDAEVREILR